LRKIPYCEFKAMLMDPKVSDKNIAQYLRVDATASDPFDPRVVPDPRAVDMGPEGRFDTRNALAWANEINRWRRQERFNEQIKDRSSLPVLVSEGDSWFQFPFLVEDVVDHLGRQYLIWSLDAAGDTADNMVRRRPEYMVGLNQQKANNVRAFLFSAAGNDVIGEDLLGQPVLKGLVRPYRPGATAADLINTVRLTTTMDFIGAAYSQVVATVRADTDFAALPILIHGYDYAIPGGLPGDTRQPLWAEQDKWLGSVMRDKGIVNKDLRSAIIRFLIDELYRVLDEVAGDSTKSHVYVVDVRTSLPQISDWADEIHPTDNGFGRVAGKFAAVLQELGIE
jgi:hypothetical protein